MYTVARFRNCSAAARVRNGHIVKSGKRSIVAKTDHATSVADPNQPRKSDNFRFGGTLVCVGVLNLYFI